MRKKREYRRGWFTARPSADPALQGQERVRMPSDRQRIIGTKPVELERTPEIERMLLLGDLVEVAAPTPSEE